ncbi:hypothetical protein MMC28_003878 [Mycoblastus sanguinarius]|nr:hypothetical protein [Mycoblastus sanguinarius]
MSLDAKARTAHQNTTYAALNQVVISLIGAGPIPLLEDTELMTSDIKKHFSIRRDEQGKLCNILDNLYDTHGPLLVGEGARDVDDLIWVKLYKAKHKDNPGRELVCVLWILSYKRPDIEPIERMTQLRQRSKVALASNVSEGDWIGVKIDEGQEECVEGEWMLV